MNNLLKDKKGLYKQIVTVIIIGFVLGMIVLFMFIAGLVFPIIGSTSHELNAIIQDAVVQTNDSALMNASQASFGNAAKGIDEFKWIVYFVIIFLFLTFIMICFYVRTYPFLAFIWILLIVLLVFVAIFLSNAYQDVIASGDSIADAYTSYGNTHYLMMYMPHIVVAIGIIGGIIMFALASRQQEAEVTAL